MDPRTHWTYLKVQCPHSGARTYDVPFQYGLHDGERWPLDILTCDNSCNDDICKRCPHALFSKLVGKDSPEFSAYVITR